MHTQLHAPGSIDVSSDIKQVGNSTEVWLRPSNKHKAIFVDDGSAHMTKAYNTCRKCHWKYLHMQLNVYAIYRTTTSAKRVPVHNM